MVQDGVASPEDIDTAMVLGYRHPVGPLKLTDMVGLDVRMNIGTYLAQELNNSAFEPPQLMKDMVSEGNLEKNRVKDFILEQMILSDLRYLFICSFQDELSNVIFSISGKL